MGMGLERVFAGNTITYTFLLIVLSLSITSPTLAQTSNQQQIYKIQQYVEEVANNLQIPSVALALVKDGKVVHTSVLGKASQQNVSESNSLLIPVALNLYQTSRKKSPSNQDRPYLIGSISKTLTAYGVLKLIEKDSISLDDPVHDYLSLQNISKATNRKELTIKHLLTHQSGIDFFTGMKYADLGLTHENAISQTIQKLFSESITLQPGERFIYNPANYLILAGIIESVTGEQYSDYMKNHVFQPLTMKNAAANEKQVIQNGLIQGYQSWFGFSIPATIGYDNSGAPYGYIAASINDMGRFLATLQKQEEIKSQMFDTRIKTSENTAYGLGTRIINTNNFTLMGHGGSNANFRSEMWLLEDTGWGFVLLTNKNHALEESYLTNISFDIASIITGNDPTPVQKSFPTGRWIFLSMVILLIPLSFYWWHGLYKEKHSINNRWFWGSAILLLTVLSIGIIPLFIKITGFPWHTLWLFIPDIIFTLLILNLILLANALLSIKYYLHFFHGKIQ